MYFGYALGGAAYAYAITLSIDFWARKLGKGMGCLAMVIVFLIATIINTCILLLAPSIIQTVVLCVNLGFVFLTIIVNSISKS